MINLFTSIIASVMVKLGAILVAKLDHYIHELERKKELQRIIDEAFAENSYANRARRIRDVLQ